MRASRFGISILMAAIAALSASAQEKSAQFPTNTVRLIVPFPAGGGTDSVARRIAEKLQAKWNKTALVENRGGAGGNIGSNFVFQAAPDGHTLLVTAPAPLTTNRFFYQEMRFDPDKFEPVSIANHIPFVLLAKGDESRFRTAADFVAYVRSNPGKLSYGTPGNGSIHHLRALWFEKITSSKVIHVPYTGVGPALNDLAAGHFDFMFIDLSSALRLTLGKKASMLAVLSPERLAMADGVPTVREAGLQDLHADTWTAVVAPPGTPAVIVGQISEAIREAVLSPDVKGLYDKLGVLAVGSTPAEARAMISAETQRWAALIAETKIKLAE